MQRGRPPKAPLAISDDDRQTLLRWTRRAKSSNALAQRARIVLRCGDGVINAAVAREFRCANATVGSGVRGISHKDSPGSSMNPVAAPPAL